MAISIENISWSRDALSLKETYSPIYLLILLVFTKDQELRWIKEEYDLTFVLNKNTPSFMYQILT